MGCGEASSVLAKRFCRALGSVVALALAVVAKLPHYFGYTRQQRRIAQPQD
jgi:hypothetical protein